MCDYEPDASQCPDTDGNPCTEPLCSMGGGCSDADTAEPQVVNGTECDDGDACLGDQCDYGECISGCGDSWACTLDQCTAEGQCTSEPDHSLCEDTPCMVGGHPMHSRGNGEVLSRRSRPAMPAPTGRRSRRRRKARYEGRRLKRLFR